jgi:predicted O-linked N-acetylglucosamine transferase (SPINDLY family)
MDKSQIEVTVISATRNGDEMTERFRQAADRFVVLAREPAIARKQLIDLDLDILMFADVGMDALTSTLAFSRMAPIQCVTWGHPDTTGSPTMDYFLSSELLEIPQAEGHYSERLVQLPLLSTFYERPRRLGKSRDRAYFQLPSDRHVYLCPQTLFKFHPEFDSILASILQADPQGDLVVLEGRVPEWTRRLQQRWTATLPSVAERVRVLPAQPRDDFLGLMECADVVIDPIHFGGGNSSYEALGLGVPVVTLPGDFLRSRITAALYRKMKLETLIANSPDSYIAMAVQLATDVDFRARVGEQILATSEVLFEDPAEVRGLESWLSSVT